MGASRVIAVALLLGVAAGIAAPTPVLAGVGVRDARATVRAFRSKDPGIRRFFAHAAGYAVFPSVGKGAGRSGTVRGSGVVFQRGRAVGKASLTQDMAGLQAGGGVYAEIVFFQNRQALAAFKNGRLTFDARFGATAMKMDASRSVRYREGVAVFTLAKGSRGGIEINIDRQRFQCAPFGKKT